MRVMLIDPWAHTVTETNTTAWGLDTIYALLTHESSHKAVDDFNVVQLAPRITLYVDGEGFLKPDMPVWYILGHGRSDQQRPLAGMGVLFGGIDREGKDLPLPEYVSAKFCQGAVTWSTKLSTGTLEPTKETPTSIIIGEPILKEASDV